MALWVCTSCTTKYAVGLFRCPRCHGTDFVEDGEPMPKITRHGGASDKTMPEPEPESAVEEESSPGSSSSASSPKPQTSSEQSKPAHPKRARTTGNRSDKDRTGSSTANGMGGDLTAPTSEPDTTE